MDAGTYSRSPSPEADDRSRRADLFGDSDDDGGRRSPSPQDRGNDGSDRDSATGMHSEAEEEKVKEKKEKKKSTKPKGPVRRMMISEDMLIGKNGLTEVQDTFKDFKFLGKGKEKEDLSRILSKYEQWIHKLHPKYPFDQCVERIEYLGLKKKPVKTMLKKIRMGLVSSADFDKPEVVEDDENDEHLFPTEENIPGTSTGINDDDLDAIMDEMETMSSTNATAAAGSSSKKATNHIADDEDEDNGIPSLEEQMELEREMQMMNSAGGGGASSVPDDFFDDPMSDNESSNPPPVVSSKSGSGDINDEVASLDKNDQEGEGTTRDSDNVSD